MDLSILRHCHSPSLSLFGVFRTFRGYQTDSRRGSTIRSVHYTASLPYIFVGAPLCSGPGATVAPLRCFSPRVLAP